MTDIWIFGYGSLMWSPGFDVLENQKAQLDGYHRDLCILSYVFRGTPEVPGLVMGLNPGGTCQGVALCIAADQKDAVMDYLHAREMINNIYTPTWVDVTLADGRVVSAYTFVALLDHDQYVGDCSLDEKVAYVLQGVGSGGTSVEYLENTCRHLRELSITDEGLEEILKRVQAQNMQKT
ncbi:gamma-glutamylcyclotransferase [Terasakiella sp. A23]|uniref:gamma-glutamylcyclotransferase n=1 Tax=Terasakiella sp. FCG-A23 TaxID=3080561 RepID=UPI0029554C85|nr:gamma-glutamylcyclotransferase [Terasakiella sp. A23]MDV7341597.1 gamma-glutamylcyclotransferase [Terasakiella sp. A23]